MSSHFTFWNAQKLSTLIFILLLQPAPVPSICRRVGAEREASTQFVWGNVTRRLVRLGKELEDCQWKRIVILCDNQKFDDQLLLEFLSIVEKINLSFAVYRVDEIIPAHVIYLEYVERRVNNVVIISQNAETILSDMNDLFHNYSKTYLSAFPHRSNFLLLSNWSTSEVSAGKSLLDNVALVEWTNKNLGRIWTLMWSDRRRRRWDEIDWNDLGSSGCNIYPNKRNGLNGREMVLLSTPFSYGVYVTNASNGDPKYAGLYIDVAKALGDQLNYTTVFVPPPTHPLPPAVYNYSSLLCNMSADFGLNIYSQDFAVQNGLKGIYPMFLSPTVAAYIYKPTNLSNVGYSFGWLVQLIMCGAFLYAVVFYKMLSVLTQCMFADQNVVLRDKAGETNNDTDLKSDVMFWGRRGASQNRVLSDKESQFGVLGFNSCTPRTEGANQTESQSNTACTNTLVKKVCRVLWTVHCSIPNFEITKFVGSHFNQSTLMRPNHLSLRIFIFFWCFYVLLITCLFTGTLTAGFVTPKKRPPFTSVTQVLLSKDVTFGSFQETEITTRSQYWKINGKNWEGRLEKFPITFVSTPQQFRDFMESSSKKLKIFIYYKHVVDFLKYHSHFDDLYLTKDYFQQGILGFVAQNNSELVGVLSSAISSLQESGIITKMSERYLGPQGEKRTRKKTPKGTSINISALKEVFYFIMAWTLAAFLALGIELLIHHTL